MKQLLFGCLAVTACGTYEENLGYTRDASARWAISIGTTAQDGARSAAIDTLGDVVAVGYQYQSSGQVAGLVSKRVASDGSERWTRTFVPLATGAQADAMSVAIGPGDAVLVGGSFQGSVDFAGSTLDASDPTPTDGSAGFVAKLSSTGQLAWVRMLDNVGVRAIATAPDGRTYVTGDFSGPLTVAGVTLSTSSADTGAVLIALDPDGVPLWGRTFIGEETGLGRTVGESLTIAPNGDVLVVGQFAAPSEFGGPVLTVTAGARSASFVTRFRADGLYLASSVVVTPGADAVGASVAIAPTGATAVSTWESHSGVVNGVRAVHVLDDAQDELWTANVSGPIAFTSDGAMLTAQWIDTGSQQGALELATVDASGFTWSTSLGARIVNAPRTSLLRAAAAGPGGGVALVGELTGTIRIAGVDLAAVGGQQDDIDALVIMIDP